jgi:hypothetical protein
VLQASSYLTIGLHRLHVRIDTRWGTTNAAEIKTRGGIGRARVRRDPSRWRLYRAAVAAGDSPGRSCSGVTDLVAAGYVDVIA